MSKWCFFPRPFTETNGKKVEELIFKKELKNLKKLEIRFPFIKRLGDNKI